MTVYRHCRHAAAAAASRRATASRWTASAREITSTETETQNRRRKKIRETASLAGYRSCTTVARNENVIFVKRVKLHFSELNWEHCWEVWRLVFEEAAKVLRLGRSLPTYHKWCIHFYCFNRLLLLLLLVAIIIIGEAKNSFSLKLISEIHSLLK